MQAAHKEQAATFLAPTQNHRAKRQISRVCARHFHRAAVKCAPLRVGLWILGALLEAPRVGDSPITELDMARSKIRSRADSLGRASRR